MNELAMNDSRFNTISLDDTHEEDSCIHSYAHCNGPVG